MNNVPTIHAGQGIARFGDPQGYRRCVIGRNVRIEAGAQVEDSVIFDHTRIGAKARLRRVVIDR